MAPRNPHKQRPLGKGAPQTLTPAARARIAAQPIQWRADLTAWLETGGQLMREHCGTASDIRAALTGSIAAGARVETRLSVKDHGEKPIAIVRGFRFEIVDCKPFSALAGRVRLRPFAPLYVLRSRGATSWRTLALEMKGRPFYFDGERHTFYLITIELDDPTPNPPRYVGE